MAGGPVAASSGPWPLPAGSRCRFTGGMFVYDDKVLPVSFAVASSRLNELARGRLLDGLSERVYHGGVEYLLRVGPAATRLARRRFASPVYRDQAMTVA